MTIVRLGLFGLPGIMAWLVLWPNLNPRYLPIAACICVGLSAASIGLGAFVGAVVPRSEARSRPRPPEATHQNGVRS